MIATPTFDAMNVPECEHLNIASAHRKPTVRLRSIATIILDAPPVPARLLKPKRTPKTLALEPTIDMRDGGLAQPMPIQWTTPSASSAVSIAPDDAEWLNAPFEDAAVIHAQTRRFVRPIWIVAALATASFMGLSGTLSALLIQSL